MTEKKRKWDGGITSCTAHKAHIVFVHQYVSRTCRHVGYTSVTLRSSDVARAFTLYLYCSFSARAVDRFFFFFLVSLQCFHCFHSASCQVACSLCHVQKEPLYSSFSGCAEASKLQCLNLLENKRMNLSVLEASMVPQIRVGWGSLSDLHKATNHAPSLQPVNRFSKQTVAHSKLHVDNARKSQTGKRNCYRPFLKKKLLCLH